MAIILFAGMLVAVFFSGNMVHALVLAQAATIVAVPAIGVEVFVLANDRRTMGDLRNNTRQINNTRQNTIALLGLLLVAVVIWSVARELLGRISSWRDT